MVGRIQYGFETYWHSRLRREGWPTRRPGGLSRWPSGTTSGQEVWGSTGPQTSSMLYFWTAGGPPVVVQGCKKDNPKCPKCLDPRSKSGSESRLIRWGTQEYRYTVYDRLLHCPTRLILAFFSPWFGTLGLFSKLYGKRPYFPPLFGTLPNSWILQLDMVFN